MQALAQRLGKAWREFVRALNVLPMCLFLLPCLHCRPSLEDMDNMERTSSMPTRLSLFGGRPSLRTSFTLTHEPHGPESVTQAAE